MFFRLSFKRPARPAPARRHGAALRNWASRCCCTAASRRRAPRRCWERSLSLDQHNGRAPRRQCPRSSHPVSHGGTSVCWVCQINSLGLSRATHATRREADRDRFPLSDLPFAIDTLRPGRSRRTHTQRPHAWHRPTTWPFPSRSRVDTQGGVSEVKPGIYIPAEGSHRLAMAARRHLLLRSVRQEARLLRGCSGCPQRLTCSRAEARRAHRGAPSAAPTRARRDCARRSRSPRGGGAARRRRGRRRWPVRPGGAAAQA